MRIKLFFFSPLQEDQAKPGQAAGGAPGAPRAQKQHMILGNLVFCF